MAQNATLSGMRLRESPFSTNPLFLSTGELDALRESLTRLQSSANQAVADLSEKEVNAFCFFC